jgi:hypothetical protein
MKSPQHQQRVSRLGPKMIAVAGESKFLMENAKFLQALLRRFLSPPFGPLRSLRMTVYSLLRHCWELCPLLRRISILIWSCATTTLAADYPPQGQQVI